MVEELVKPSVTEGKAMSKPAPEYPLLAEMLRVKGNVEVAVVINEEGRVTSAKANSGHWLLKKSAVDAAYRARFTPTLLSGQPVKVTGIITYRFRVDG